MNGGLPDFLFIPVNWVPLALKLPVDFTFLLR
jgi:hypothetical protein